MADPSSDSDAAEVEVEAEVVLLGEAADLDPATFKQFFSDGDAAGEELSWPEAEAIVSKLSKAEIPVLCSRYSVPDAYNPLGAGQLGRASTTPAEGTRAVCVYAAALEAGMRFPLHGFYVKVLRHYRLAPSQLTPNSWAYMAAFVRLCEDAGVEPLVSVFRYFFTISAHKNKGGAHKNKGGAQAQSPSGWHHILPFPEGTRKRSRCRRLFTAGAGGNLNSWSGWKSRFFFLQASSPAKSWACPVKWGKPRRADVRPPQDAVDATIRKLLEQAGETGVDLTALLSQRSFPVGTHDSDLVELPPAAAVKTEAVAGGPGASASSTGKRKSPEEPVTPPAPQHEQVQLFDAARPGFTAAPTAPWFDSGHQGTLFGAQGYSCERSLPPGMRTSDALQIWEAMAAGERDKTQLQDTLRAANGEVAKLRRELREVTNRESRLTGSLREAQEEVALLREEHATECALHLRATGAQLNRLEEEQAGAVAQLSQEHAADIARLNEEHAVIVKRLKDTAGKEVRDAVLTAKKEAVLAILPKLDPTLLKFVKLD